MLMPAMETNLTRPNDEVRSRDNPLPSLLPRHFLQFVLLLTPPSAGRVLCSLDHIGSLFLVVLLT